MKKFYKLNNNTKLNFLSVAAIDFKNLSDENKIFFL
jgi:hypothetical protein